MKPKLLVVARNFYIPLEKKINTGGGAISNYILLDYLKKYYSIVVLTDNSNLPLGDIEIDGFNIKNIQPTRVKNGGIINRFLAEKEYKKHLSSMISELKPSLIMTQTVMISLCASVAKKQNIKSVAWIRAYENFYSDSPNIEKSILKKIDKYLQMKFYKERDRIALNRIDLILTNSKYMKKTVDEYFGVNSKVIYPPISQNMGNVSIESKKKQNKIGFIKPEPKKGLDIVVKIAKKIPDYEIVCYGKPPHNKEEICRDVSNIKFAGWINDQKQIFDNIQLLLVPSVWYEPFGRVGVEAISHGVIPIVSNRGGIPEAVGNSNFILNNIYDIDEWVEKILSFMSTEEKCNKSLLEGQEYISQFTPKIQGQQLYVYLDELLQTPQQTL